MVRYGEIDAGDAEAKGQKADEGAGQSRDRHRHQEAEPRADAEMHVERRRRIGAEPDIERMAERQLPGKAHHDVPALTDIGEVQDQNEHGEQIVAGKQRRRDQHDQQRAEQQQGAARNTLEQARDHAALFMWFSCP